MVLFDFKTIVSWPCTKIWVLNHISCQIPEFAFTLDESFKYKDDSNQKRQICYVKKENQFLKLKKMKVWLRDLW
jgi:hypothetical protein